MTDRKCMNFFFLALTLFACACTKHLEQVHQPEAVIESYLLPGQPVLVRINWEVPWGVRMDTLTPLENLSPVLVQNHTEHKLTYMGKGMYGNPNIRLQEKDSCHLYFNLNGKEVSAHTVIPGKPTGFVCNTDTVRRIGWNTSGEIIDPAAIELTWNNPGNDYHMVVIQYPNAEPWWTRPVNPTDIPSSVYYAKPTKETIAWVRTADVYLANKNYMLLYSILPEYAIMFNENHSNLLNVTAPPLNITNGNGIFTGISVADTLTLYARYR